MWVIDCLSFFLVPSRNSNMPVYSQSAMSQGTCPDSLLFYCFHLANIWIYHGTWECINYIFCQFVCFCLIMEISYPFGVFSTFAYFLFVSMCRCCLQVVLHHHDFFALFLFLHINTTIIIIILHFFSWRWKRYLFPLLFSTKATIVIVIILFSYFMAMETLHPFVSFVFYSF